MGKITRLYHCCQDPTTTLTVDNALDDEHLVFEIMDVEGNVQGQLVFDREQIESLVMEFSEKLDLKLDLII